MKITGRKLSDMHKEWMEDSTYREVYEELEEEFALASALIEARSNAVLTQQQIAERGEL